MGNETKQQLSLRGLQNAAGFLQSRIADRIETRYTPRLQFVLDAGIKKSLEDQSHPERVCCRRTPSRTRRTADTTDAAAIVDEEATPDHWTARN